MAEPSAHANPAPESVTATFETIAELRAVLLPVMKAVTAAVGQHCEVVLHDLSGRDLSHSIDAIENGHVTGRSVGGPSTNLGFDVLSNESAEHDSFGYLGQTSNGRQLHCSSVYYRNSAGSVIGALCVNIDLTALQNAKTILNSLLPMPPADTSPKEVFGADISTVLDSMIEAGIDAVGKGPAMMDKADRVAVLRYLETRGAFAVKRSVEHVARRLGVSRVTAYGYLEELRGNRA